MISFQSQLETTEIDVALGTFRSLDSAPALKAVVAKIGLK
jgi:hypothetical protein